MIDLFFMLFNEFTEMGKVGIIVFGTIQIDDQTFGVVRKRGRKLPSSVLMNETSPALGFVFNDKTIDGADGTVELKSSTLFITIGINKFLDKRIFKIFIHT